MMFYHFVRRGVKYCSLFILFIFGYCAVSAQDTTTSDGLLQAARHAAFKEDNYPKAIAYCQKALSISPNYTDISIFLGRIYAWSKNYDSARSYFQTALAQKPKYEDAYIGYVDMEYWNDNYNDALALCNKGLKNIPNSTALMLRKAKIFYALRQFKVAGLIVDTLLSIDNSDASARALLERIRDEISFNKVIINYDYVYFDKQFSDPWHLASVDYTRSTKLGSFTGRVDYANRFKENGVQYELEGYPHISKMFYSYVNVGYSDNVGVFSRWRAGLSLFSNLPHAFEAELGMRYLYFTSSTDIFTAYIGKYYKSYLFGVRTYLTPDNQYISQSYSALARYYFGGAYDYIGLTIGTGISPDDQSVSYLLNSHYKLLTYKAGLDFMHTIKRFNIITLDASIINQEYRPGTKGNQIQVGAGYQRRF